LPFLIQTQPGCHLPQREKKDYENVKGGRLQCVGFFKVINCFILHGIPKSSPPYCNEERPGSNISCSNSLKKQLKEEAQQKYIYTSSILLYILDIVYKGEKQNDKNSSEGSAVIIIFVSLLISLDPNFYRPYICYRARKTKHKNI
jgi:hypothetical protein